MARPIGRKNQDYERKRSALARASAHALLRADGQPATLGDLARAAGVSVPTLKHYFGDYEGIFAAALAVAEADGEGHMQAARDPGSLTLQASMAAYMTTLIEGWPRGLGGLFSGALTHGLGHGARGPAVVTHLLEPSLQTVEARLAVHAARGELRTDVDLRVAALAFVSPLLMALLHQHELSGVRCRPLEMAAFGEAHLQGWVAGWGAAP